MLPPGNAWIHKQIVSFCWNKASWCPSVKCNCYNLQKIKERLWKSNMGVFLFVIWKERPGGGRWFAACWSGLHRSDWLLPWGWLNIMDLTDFTPLVPIVQYLPQSFSYIPVLGLQCHNLVRIFFSIAQEFSQYTYTEFLFLHFSAFDWTIMVRSHGNLPGIHSVPWWLQSSFCGPVYSAFIFEVFSLACRG